MNATQHPVINTDIAIIGAGSGGLSVAAGAAQLGVDVTLIERGRMGGDCLNTGCVPSKALIAAADAAQTVRSGARFGVNGHEPDVDFASVNAHVHSVIGAIEPHDSVERFEGLGVRVIQASARFISPREIEVDGQRIRARRFVIATGSSPALPPISGLDTVTVHTNESIFELTERPQHLVVIGGGPIGIEMAQAHRRLGSEVTVVELGRILAKDDAEAVEVVRRRLVSEGLTLHEGVTVSRVEAHGNGVRVVVEREGDAIEVDGTHLLVAAGRRANVDGLGLEEAGVAHSARGIEVDSRLRTSNRRIFAIGDVAGGLQFTHMAGYHAGIVIRNALFRLPAKIKLDAVPWVTYTDPELAHVGLDEAAARARHGDKVKTVRWSFEDNDRAQAEQATEGFVKVVTGPRGRILGATVVGRHAGELLAPWILAIDQRMKIGAMANLILPYPTLGEVSKRAAGSYFTPALFSPRTRGLVRALAHLG